MTTKMIVENLGMLLRAQPRGSVAHFSDFSVAYWNGRCVIFCYLDEDGQGTVDEEFALADHIIEEWEPVFSAWFSAPTYQMRPEMVKWIKDVDRPSADSTW